MERFLPSFSTRMLCVLVSLFISNNFFAQITVFTDDFNTSAGTAFTTSNGAIGSSSDWNLTRSGADFAGKINSGILTLTNDSGGTANTSGWVMASTNTASFDTPYNTILASNPGIVTWTFNMRQINTNPSGFGTSGTGAAFILAGTAGTTNVVGSGYAVVLGNSGSADPIKLVRYTSGLRTATTLITSNTTGLTDFGQQYLSVKVTFSPSTNTWQLFVRNDGTTAFQNPASGVLVSQGTVINNSSTAAPLQIMGAFWNVTYNYFSSANRTSFFDNVKVTVAVPEINSVSPSSKVAGTGTFTITLNGSNFVNGSSLVRWNGSSRTTTFVSATQLTASITASDIVSSGTAAVTVSNGAAVSNALSFTIDPAGEPAISVSNSSLVSLSTITGTASPYQNYTVSGANLTSDVTVTPPANFEVSTNGTTYSNAVVLTRSGNVLTGQPVTVYNRIKASAPSGIYSGTLQHSTTGGTSKQVAISGVVLTTQPTTASTAITFTNVTSSVFTLNFSAGNGGRRLVLIKAASAVNAAPVDGLSYMASASFGTGTEIGTGNYTVYAGTGNAVTIGGLSPSTVYHVAVFEFNGISGTENYHTSSAIGNRSTLNAPVGWQIYATNTTNTIDFDNTVDGVNEDAFQGSGFSPMVESGGLSSTAWAISGFSDGNLNFGGDSGEDNDFDRGTSEGNTSEGGVYSFETSTDNFSLGLATATGDFAPGSATLRFQNQTGATVTSLSLGYKVYIYNNQAGSNSFNFSHSADNNTYTAVAGINLTSPTTADVAPEWKAYYRVVTITGINVANNNYYYLRWNGAVISGSVTFDEFALDDIVLVANPTSNFASFGGNATQFIVQGNTTLTTDINISTNLTINAGKLDVNGKTMTLGGSVINNSLGGIKGSSNSNLVINGSQQVSLSFDQTIPNTTNVFNNVSVNTTAGNTVNLLNAAVINGTLTTSSGQTLNLGTNALTGTLVGIANNGTISTQNTTPTPLPTGKTWSGSGTINYNATTAQSVVAGTYQNLTVNTTAGGVATGNLTVNNVLNLPSSNPSATIGSLSMGPFVLTMGANSTNEGIGDVTGIVTRNSISANTLYTFGNTHTSILFPPVGTLPSSMSLKIAIGAAPSWRTGAINRTFDFIQTGGSGTKAVIKAHYLDSELNGNLESKLVDWARIVASNTVLEQGRSNFNTTDNWVELTNVNVGLYFSNVFNAVLLTLDESEASSLTWNGSVSTSWTTAANWTPNATPSDFTSVFIPNATITPNDPILNPAVLLGSLTIDSGGILNAPNDSQLTINNGAGSWINNGIFNPGAGTSNVIFTNLDATIAGVTNFNNLTINSGGGLRPVTNNLMRIAGSLVRNGNLLTGSIANTIEYNGINQTLASPNGTLPAYYNLIVSGMGAIVPSTLNITGNLTLNQPVNFNGNTLTMMGQVNQLIGGTASANLNNLLIANLEDTVSLSTNTFINGTLTLTSGKLNIGSYNLTLGNNPVSGAFSSNTMIVASGSGEVRRTFTTTGGYLFPIGDNTENADYSPITVFMTSGAFSNAYVGVSVTDAIHPNNASSEEHISRYWKVNQSGITGAVATISANYVGTDLIGLESQMSAAQLQGIFNVATNPWLKYSALNSNTLTASAVNLTAGMVSAFTGIKGAPFSAPISGYGSFCQNEIITLSANPTGGDAPFTYVWSNGLGSQSSATPPTNTAGTTSYTVTVKDSNGITATDTVNVTTVSPTIGGAVLSNQSICINSTPNDLVLSGYNGTILYWEKADNPTFSNSINIANTTATLSGALIGGLTTTTYFRAVLQNGSCELVPSSGAIIAIESTTYNGTWSNGIPTASKAAIISADFTASEDLEACSLLVNNNAIVNIPSDFNVTLNGALTVNSGTFTLGNNANLIQLSDVANLGNIIVQRNSAPIMRLDYTLWSSPVSGQLLQPFSPGTVSNRFYTYNAATDLYNAVPLPSTTLFQTGTAYLIRARNTHPVTPTIWSGVFQGIPNNGNYAIAATQNAYNAVGNPYPSTIDADAFITSNNITEALYFWRKTNNDLTSSYATYTLAGGTGTKPNTGGDPMLLVPNGVIQVGQGFIVKSSATAINFTNAMRIANNDNQFFRTSTMERNRIWLNLTNNEGIYSQTLVSYMTGATQGVDAAIDGLYFNDSQVALTSLIDNNEYAVQGRSLPFENSDVVPLSFKAINSGNYTIGLDHVDGLFAYDSQVILLRDNTTNSTHDLKDGAYSFASEAGIFKTRFELVYQTNLAITNPEWNANQIIVYKQANEIVINSGKIVMSKVQLFDVSGRLLASLENVNASEAKIAAGSVNQVLIVKIISQDGNEVSKKLVN